MRGFHFLKKLNTNIPYLTMLLALAVFAYNFPGRLSIDLFLILFITAIVNLVHFVFSLYQLEIDQEDIIEGVEKSEVAKVKLTLRNKSIFPVAYVYIKPYDGFRLRLRTSEQVCVFLGSKEEIKLILEYEPKLCGKQEVGAEMIYLVDYLSFFRKKLKMKYDSQMKVLPDIKPLNEYAELSSALENASDRQDVLTHHEATHILGEISYELEPYIQGDSLRLLHWKIAAQKGLYMVRKREEGYTSSVEMVLILNPLYRDQGNIEEAYILQDQTLKTYLSLAYEFVNNQQQVTLMYFMENTWKKYTLKSKYEFKFIREQLASYEGIGVVDKEDYSRILPVLLETTQKAELKCFILGDWDEVLKNSIWQYEGKGGTYEKKR